MEIVNTCIYCGRADDLSNSDIIPDALTNAKIINPCVCRIEHNNKFSDMFEDYIIKHLAIFTNELDIKSSKGKKYAPYDATIVVDNTEYTTRMSSDAELFRDGRIISTLDGKTKLGDFEQLKKFKGATEDNIKTVDINQLEIEKRIILKTEPFFSLEMHRLMTKIAFEWYCLNNGVIGKYAEFDSIIEFIVNGTGTNPVSFISNAAIYNLFDEAFPFGSHILLSYIAVDGSVNIVVSLFGLAAYNIRILNAPIEKCAKNTIFQQLTLDAKRSQFFFKTIDDLHKELSVSFRKIVLPGNLEVCVPKNMDDFSLQHKMFYVINYQLFQKELRCISEPNEDAINLLKSRMEAILQASALTVRGLKRFVKERKDYLAQGYALNPKGTDKKSIFLFYCLYVLGKHDSVKAFNDLFEYIKEKFGGDSLSIDDECTNKLYSEILSDENYFKTIKAGAEIVELWKYE